MPLLRPQHHCSWVLSFLTFSMEQLLAHMPTLTRVARIEKERAESFVDDTERIVLIGEAAHPMGVRTLHTTAPLRPLF